jgi:hypothetical protein
MSKAKDPNILKAGIPDQLQSDILKKWRDKIKLTIDDRGYVLAGWGYRRACRT